MTIILILFFVALVLFATEWLPVDVTALLLLSALVLLGLIDPKEAFAGFGSDTVLTLASLFILTQMLLRAGVIEWIGQSLAKKAGNASGMLRGILSTVAAVSAFTSNTATTAVFLPVVTALSRRAGIPPSQVLMPLAFASILGGSVTLIGTSTNLVVSGALPAAGLKPLGFFELSAVGLPIALVGMLYLFFVAPRLLPKQDAELEDQLRAYLADLTVAEQSPLVGQSLRATGLGRDYGLVVVAVRRGERTIYAPGPEFVIEPGDTLAVEGPTDRILAGKNALGVFSKSEQKLQAQTTERVVKLVEVVVLPGSTLIGRTLRESRFRERFGLSVLALHRRNRTVERLGGLRINVGDVLLIQGGAEKLSTLGDHLAVLDDLSERQSDLKKAPLALALFGGAVLLGGLGLLPLGVAVVVAVALALAFHLVTPEEAYRSVEWPVLVLVACMLAFGTAFEESGAARFLTQALSHLIEPLGPYGLLGSLFVVTVLLTQPMSNQAAALVMLPLAIGTAKALGYDPRPFVIGITIAASNSFITPLEPSCMLVYGPGRYRFSDFVKVGTGLTLVTLLVAMLIIPRVWAF